MRGFLVHKAQIYVIANDKDGFLKSLTKSQLHKKWQLKIALEKKKTV